VIIACDIDGCLSNFNKGYRILFPDHDFPESSPDFPPVWSWPEYYGVSKKAVSVAWKTIKNSKTFWEELESLPQANEALKALNKLRRKGKNEVYFLTTRAGFDCKGQTWRWLKKRGFNDPTILISVQTPQAKGYVCAGLGVDVIIDDRALNLNNVHAPTRRYLVDAAYNRVISSPHKCTRISTVYEALEAEDLV